MSTPMYTTKNRSVISVFFRAFLSPRTFKPAILYIWTVIIDFFLLQFAVKFGFKKISIINVDHPLDKKVPFTPDKVSVYLDFVAFWIRPLDYIGFRFGRKVQAQYTASFLHLVRKCYRDAAQVYRFRMTTTSRPAYYKGSFRIIHMFDPHYLCVPSLHVIIVVLAYTFYRKAFAELGMPTEEANALNKEMFEGAVKITETVLYIKQHSVNCIPAALYAMTRITPQEVTPEEVVNFVNYLFTDNELVNAEDSFLIREYILDMYEQLFLHGCQDDNWITPLQRWLTMYEATGSIQEQ